MSQCSAEVLTYFLCSFPTWQILENKRSLDKLKDVIAMNASELSEVTLPTVPARVTCCLGLAEEQTCVRYIRRVKTVWALIGQV